MLPNIQLKVTQQQEAFVVSFGTKSREKYRYSSVNLHSSDGPPNRQNGSKTPSIRTSQKADEHGEKYYTTVSNYGSPTKEVLPIKNHNAINSK